MRLSTDAFAQSVGHVLGREFRHVFRGMFSHVRAALNVNPLCIKGTRSKMARASHAAAPHSRGARASKSCAAAQLAAAARARARSAPAVRTFSIITFSMIAHMTVVSNQSDPWPIWAIMTDGEKQRRTCRHV